MARDKRAYTTSTLSTRTNRFALQGGSWKINSSLGGRELSTAAGRERGQEIINALAAGPNTGFTGVTRLLVPIAIETVVKTT